LANIAITSSEVSIELRQGLGDFVEVSSCGKLATTKMGLMVEDVSGKEVLLTPDRAKLRRIRREFQPVVIQLIPFQCTAELSSTSWFDLGLLRLTFA